jgi:hypothetical protein
MLVECTHCGAPLDVSTAKGLLRCGYCQRTHRIGRMRTLAEEKPEGWEQPATWAPRSEMRGAQPLAYGGSRSVSATVIQVVVTLAIALGGVLPSFMMTGGFGGFFFGGRKSALEGVEISPSVRAGGPSKWDGTTPFTCGGNDSVTLTGITAELGEATAMTVEANCELRLVDCTIRGWDGIHASGNRAVVLENSRIEVEGAGIVVSGNKRLELRNSQVRAGAVAIRGSGNAHITLGGGRIQGDTGALTLESNARAEVNKTDVEGAIDAKPGWVTGLPSP